ncbi:hypothetical protein ACQPZP_26010 [Spirillospora sp. CA-142024]|uniref:hypothetical protein n=1 Tax=Spirillospora sp. CA-142024 TaxID=3240036 RepID=UPI003D93476A
MIAAVVCVPQAPLLLPGLTGRPVPEVEQVRAAIGSALPALTGLDELIVIGAAPATGTCPRDAPDPAARLAPGPLRRPEPDPLPVPLAIGRSLLDGPAGRYVLHGVHEHATTEECLGLGRRLATSPRRTGLLIVADGSARRGEKAPGYTDPRALDLDARITRALDTADTAALLALDSQDCANQLIAGRAAWQVMASACQNTSWTTNRLYDDDPFGVAYHVLTWLPMPQAPATSPTGARNPAT